MTKETRRVTKETFVSLGEVLSLTGSVKSIITTPKLIELVAKAKDCLHELDENPFEVFRDNDFHFDIAKAIEAIENYQSEVKGGRNGDEWLNTARERLRIVNDCLKGW